MIAVPRSGDGSEATPYACDLSGVRWQDRVGQPVEHIKIDQQPYTVEVWCSDAQLSDIESDGRFVVLWSVEVPEGDSPEPEPVIDATAIQAALQSLYAEDVAVYVTEQDDPVDSLIWCQRRQPWVLGDTFYDGSGEHEQSIRSYGDNLYKCVIGHTATDPNSTPPNTPNLWVKFYEADAGPQPWEQPAGAHDAYQRGDRVTHNSYVWESSIDDNVWEPGVYGWTQIEPV
jgi:hypothetical protein